MGRRLFYFCLPLTNDKQIMGQYTTTAIPNTPTLGGNSRNLKNYYIVNYNGTAAYNTRLTTATLLMTPRANHVLLQLEEQKQDYSIPNGTSVIDMEQQRKHLPETNGQINGLNMEYNPLSMNILANGEHPKKSNQSNIGQQASDNNDNKKKNDDNNEKYSNDNRPKMTLEITRSNDLNQIDFNDNGDHFDSNLFYQSNHYQHSYLNQTNEQHHNKIKFNNKKKCAVSKRPLNHCHNSNDNIINNKPQHNQNHYHYPHHQHHHYYHHQKRKQQIGPIFSIAKRTIADDQMLNRETTL